MRKMSKAAKAEAYDALNEQSSLMELLLHDIALEREPDAIERAEEMGCDAEDSCVAVGKLYRATGALGGIVLLRTFTRYADGSPDSSSDSRAIRLDDMPALAGREGYWRTAYGRAIYSLAAKLRDRRAYWHGEKQ